MPITATRLGFAEVNQINVRDFVVSAIKECVRQSENHLDPTALFFTPRLGALLLDNYICDVGFSKMLEERPELRNVRCGKLCLRDLESRFQFGCDAHYGSKEFRVVGSHGAEKYDLVFEVPRERT